MKPANLVCASMIVRQEAHVIERCLDSLIGIVDCLAIVDTGSTDGTVETIRAWQKQHGIPGRVESRGWVDFGTGRNQALDLTRRVLQERAADMARSYAFIFDADAVFSWPDGCPLDRGHMALELRRAIGTAWAEAYHLRFTDHQGIYGIAPRWLRMDLPWVWRCPVRHEYVEIDGRDAQAMRVGIQLEGSDERWEPFSDERYDSGIRNRYGAANWTDKFWDDIEALEGYLARDDIPHDDRTRCTFYLAGAYGSVHEHERASELFRERIAMTDGTDQECFLARMDLGKIHSYILPEENATWWWHQAWEYAPHRAEPLLRLAIHAHQRELWGVAAQYAALAMTREEPGVGDLSVDYSVYRWRAKYQYALAIGNVQPRAALPVFQELLGLVPPEMVENIRLNIERLGEGYRARPVSVRTGQHSAEQLGEGAT